MRPSKVARAAGTGGSVPVECCQVCGHAPLDDVLSLGYMPPVNQMVPIGSVPRQQPWFPTKLLYCRNCDLVQLGLAVDPVIIFPPEYPYTSGTTKLLRDNFAELHASPPRCSGFGKDDLVVDIGSNDGTLLSNFQKGGHRVLGIEPTDVGEIANERGIPTIKRYFGPEVAREVKREHGPASGRHRRQLLRPYRGRARDRRRHRRDAAARRRIHFRIALSHRAARHAAIRHRSITSTCATIRWQPQASAGDARPRSVPRAADPEPRRLDPRLCRAEGHAPGAGQRAADARRRAARRRDGKRLAAFRRDVVLSKLRLHALLRDIKEKGAPHRRHQRAVARLDAGQLCRARRGHHRLRLRDRGLAEDRQMHAGHADSGGRGEPAVRRPAGMRHDLLLAHRRRAGAQAPGQGLQGPIDHAAAGAAGRAGCAMGMDSIQDKQKEIAFFDAHAASDEYDVFTPEATRG